MSRRLIERMEESLDMTGKEWTSIAYVQSQLSRHYNINLLETPLDGKYLTLYALNIRKKYFN